MLCVFLRMCFVEAVCVSNNCDVFNGIILRTMCVALLLCVAEHVFSNVVENEFCSMLKISLIVGHAC